MMEELLAKALTAGQIIEELQKLPPETKVLAEGCDCINPTSNVETFHTNGQMWASIEVDTTLSGI